MALTSLPPRAPTAGDDALEARISAEARRFELPPLLFLLTVRLGYGPSDLVFQSHQEPSSASSVVDAVEFCRSPRGHRYVLVTLNIGLLADGGLLPGYMQRLIAELPNPEHFFDFLRFFDHWLLSARVRALHPELAGGPFGDWDRTKAHLLRIRGIGSPLGLAWVFRAVFPELIVRVTRRPLRVGARIDPFRTGGLLDGSTVLGARFDSVETGFLVELGAEEEDGPGGRLWAQIVRDRLARDVLPRLRGSEIGLRVRLVIGEFATRAALEAPGDAKGYLGYERLGGAPGLHSVLLHPDPGVEEREYHLVREERLAIVLMEGELSAARMVRTLEAMLRDPRFQPSTSVLFDLRGVSARSDLDLRPLFQLTLRRMPELGRSRWAMVLPPGIGRAFRALARRLSDVELSVFATRTDAEHWLSVPELERERTLEPSEY